MAKHEPKITLATDPTIAPPPLVAAPSPDDVATEPEIEDPVPSTLPAGVAMVDAGRLPYTTDRDGRAVPDPARPPPGWKGSFASCGGCGAFIGNADRCPKCAPKMPSNVSNHGG